MKAESFSLRRPPVVRISPSHTRVGNERQFRSGIPSLIIEKGKSIMGAPSDRLQHQLERSRRMELTPSSVQLEPANQKVSDVRTSLLEDPATSNAGKERPLDHQAWESSRNLMLRDEVDELADPQTPPPAMDTSKAEFVDRQILIFLSPEATVGKRATRKKTKAATRQKYRAGTSSFLGPKSSRPTFEQRQSNTQAEVAIWTAQRAKFLWRMFGL